MKSDLLSRLVFTSLLVCLLMAGLARLQAADPVPGIIDVKVSGSGPVPVLLIPGLATPASIWNDTVTALDKDATCYVVNLAGFGGMPPVGKREHFLADVRDAIIAYIHEHRLDHPVLVGHSLGGNLALDIAAKTPDLPARLLITDSLPFLAGLMDPDIKTQADMQKIAPLLARLTRNDNPQQFAESERQVVPMMVTSPAKAAALAAQMGKSDPATVDQALRELVSADRRPQLPAILCPVLVLGALADKVARGSTREAVEQTYRAQYANLPQVKFQFFPDARHFIMVDAPAEFLTTIKAQLREAAANPSPR